MHSHSLHNYPKQTSNVHASTDLFSFPLLHDKEMRRVPGTFRMANLSIHDFSMEDYSSAFQAIGLDAKTIDNLLKSKKKAGRGS